MAGHRALNPHILQAICCNGEYASVYSVALARSPQRSFQLRLRRPPVVRLVSTGIFAVSQRHLVRNVGYLFHAIAFIPLYRPGAAVSL